MSGIDFEENMYEERAFIGFKKEGKYYLTLKNFGGGYQDAGYSMLKGYINNTREDFKNIFNMIEFKDAPEFDDTEEGQIKEGLFYRRYNLDGDNLITLINTKDVDIASKDVDHFDKYRVQIDEKKNDFIIVMSEDKVKVKFYDSIKHYEDEDERVDGKLNLANCDIFDASWGSKYAYIYDFDKDELNCYSLKSDKYLNIDNKEELKVNTEDSLYDDEVKFVNTFKFIREMRLRRYMELFDSWNLFEYLNDNSVKEAGISEEMAEYKEYIVQKNLDEFLKVLSKD